MDNFCQAYLLHTMSLLLGDNDMIVACAGDPDFYIREDHLVIHAIAPAAGVDDPDTVVHDAGASTVLSSRE